MKKGDVLVADVLFETSFEVCNKVGGIYTVITSKVPVMKSYYDTYFTIGPLFDVVPAEFLEQQPPEIFNKVFSELYQQGIVCKYGIWDTPGKPKTILIDGRSLLSQADAIKGTLWERYQIDSMGAGYDFTEPMCWSWAVGIFLEKIAEQYQGKKIIGHFHEWLSGFGALYLDSINSSIGTVFTTHATMLGRSAASHGVSLCHGNTFDPVEKAYEYGVQNKFTTERACAQTAKAFTTVSDITASEAEIILGRKPIVTPNGLALEYYPTFEDASYRHVKNKHKLQRFVTSHFFLQQHFDLEHTYFFCYGGRYEYKNKGLDVTVNALARLNHHLKESGSKKTVVMLFLVAMNAGEPKSELLENKGRVTSLLSDLQDKSDQLLQKLMLDIIVGDERSIEIIPHDELEQLREQFNYVRRQGNPLLSTHNMDNEEHDPLLNHLREVGLTNKPEDKVKAVMIPSYLEGKDGLLNIKYQDAVNGSHLAIFPSFYEPWGYTPLESIALGVPTVTSLTAGFGQYMKPKMLKDQSGLFIVDRCMDDETVTQDLFTIMHDFIELTKNQRVTCKMHAHNLSAFCDWRQLIKPYLEAHEKALE